MQREAALDFDSLARRLRQRAAEAGWRLVVEASTTSTNEAVRRLVAAEEQGVTGVALAASQTAGVGRRGARWMSEAGDGLWFSVVVPAQTPVAASPPSLALAGELAQRLRDAGVPAEVKWPNDLYLGEGKLGGLMLERGRFGPGAAWLAGVGINWRLPSAPADDDYRPAALEAAPAGAWRADPVGLAVEIVAASVAVLAAPAAWPGLLEQLRRRHRWFGVPVTVCPEDAPAYHGVGGEIRPDGRLEVKRADGRVAVIGPNDRVRAASPG